MIVFEYFDIARMYELQVMDVKILINVSLSLWGFGEKCCRFVHIMVPLFKTFSILPLFVLRKSL